MPRREREREPERGREREIIDMKKAPLLCRAALKNKNIKSDWKIIKKMHILTIKFTENEGGILECD